MNNDHAQGSRVTVDRPIQFLWVRNGASSQPEANALALEKTQLKVLTSVEKGQTPAFSVPTQADVVHRLWQEAGQRNF
jgi:hypothetical protein